MARTRRRSALAGLSRTVAPGVRVLGLLAVVCLVSAGVILGPSLLNGDPTTVPTVTAPEVTAPAAPEAVARAPEPTAPGPTREPEAAAPSRTSAPPAVPPELEAAADDRGVEYEEGVPVIEASPLGPSSQPERPAANPEPPAPARVAPARQAPPPAAAPARDVAPATEAIPEQPAPAAAPPARQDPPAAKPTPPAEPPARAVAPAAGSPSAAEPQEEPSAATGPGFQRELRLSSSDRMNGEDVRRVQLRLMELTGEDITRGGDGWYGPRTTQGVREFQARNGLPVTGVVDRSTWDRLLSLDARGTARPAPAPATEERAARDEPPAPAATAGAPGFRRELRVLEAERLNGEDVRRVQIRLMTLAGEDPSRGGDGWYGPRTATGVRQFQARNGLPVTGVVDRRTWDALFSGSAR